MQNIQDPFLRKIVEEKLKEEEMELELYKKWDKEVNSPIRDVRVRKRRKH